MEERFLFKGVDCNDGNLLVLAVEKSNGKQIFFFMTLATGKRFISKGELGGKIATLTSHVWQWARAGFGTGTPKKVRELSQLEQQHAYKITEGVIGNSYYGFSDEQLSVRTRSIRAKLSNLVC